VTAVLAAFVSLYAAFVVWYFTALEGVDYEELLEQFPPAVLEAFGIEALSTIAGLLGTQVLNFVWLFGLGLYVAYAGGSLIAGDIENDRMDLLVSFSVSRSRLLVKKFASLLLPIVGVNVVTGGVVYVLVVGIGETIDPAHLALVHLLSVPYLLVCAAIGVVFSVLVDRAAVGTVFLLFLVESVVKSSTDFERVRLVSPTNYYEPTRILIDGSYGLLDIGVLLAAFLALLAVSQVLFRRRDI